MNAGIQISDKSVLNANADIAGRKANYTAAMSNHYNNTNNFVVISNDP